MLIGMVDFKPRSITKDILADMSDEYEINELIPVVFFFTHEKQIFYFNNKIPHLKPGDCVLLPIGSKNITTQLILMPFGITTMSEVLDNVGTY